MEEGRSFSKSVLHASENIYDFNCSPCLDEGRYNEALQYCVSCKLYYCKKCLGDHNKFPALKGHRIQDVESMNLSTTSPVGTKAKVAPLTELCEHHPDELIKMYCSGHEVVCCTVCIALDHRDCEGIDYIPKVAKDIRASEGFKDFLENMEILKEQYQETKEEIQREIQKITDISKEVINDIKRFKQEILKTLDELENKSIATVNERCEQLREKMNMTVSKVDKFLEEMKDTLREVDKESEATLFVRMLRARQHEEVKDEIDRDINEFEGFNISLDKRIHDALSQTDGLVKADAPCQVNVKNKHQVTFDSDNKETCGITDICIVNDGTIVMSDSNNETVKRFSKTFGKIGKISVNGICFGICKSFKYDEFIVALFDGQKAQFVKYTDTAMVLKKSFKVGAPCRGICLVDENFFISCGGGPQTSDIVTGHIRKFDLSGNLLCTIETDDSGNRLFAHPRHLTTNLDRTKVYVADGVKGVIVLDTTGNKIGQYKRVNLKGAYSVSCFKYGNFVSGIDSINVQQFDDNYKFVGTVLDESDELQAPCSLCYIESNDQMILGMELSDEVLLTEVRI